MKNKKSWSCDPYFISLSQHFLFTFFFTFSTLSYPISCCRSRSASNSMAFNSLWPPPYDCIIKVMKSKRLDGQSKGWSTNMVCVTRKTDKMNVLSAGYLLPFLAYSILRYLFFFFYFSFYFRSSLELVSVMNQPFWLFFSVRLRLFSLIMLRNKQKRLKVMATLIHFLLFFCMIYILIWNTVYHPLQTLKSHFLSSGKLRKTLLWKKKKALYDITSQLTWKVWVKWVYFFLFTWRDQWIVI